jgi:hypothetical protein
MTPEQQRLNALQFELSRRIDAARASQNALMAERRRQKLPVAQAFYTADEMTAERVASRVETNALISAAICEARLKYDAGYRPDRHHAALIELSRSFAAEAKRAKATTGNVIPLRATEAAQQIIAAAKKARGET